MVKGLSIEKISETKDDCSLIRTGTYNDGPPMAGSPSPTTGCGKMGGQQSASHAMLKVRPLQECTGCPGIPYLVAGLRLGLE